MKSLVFLFTFLFAKTIFAQSKLDSLIPVRGFCIAAPSSGKIDKFVRFIEEELASRKVNTLILRVDFNYQFKKYPHLSDSVSLSDTAVKKLVAVCRKHKIKLIPQINLLGHQSWATKTNNLLAQYPHFDETPHVNMPEKFVWPNEDGLYCKSYCPLHPDVHAIVFSLVDEICEAFEATDFHAGMDEVFYIGNDKCPRCQGRDKAELFAGEVNKIRNHLALSNRKLWIWGDRLIDGKTTGIGEWEGSYNQTFRAVDLLYKDVVICDWHYERPDPTAVYFAMKGFNVITCPWRTPEVAIAQLHQLQAYRNGATTVMKPRYSGMMQTVWTSFESFLKEMETWKSTPSTDNSSKIKSSAACFISLFDEMKNLSNE
jgi:hypothetical protein